MKKFLVTSILLLVAILNIKAENLQPSSRASLKAKYEYVHMSMNSKKGVREPFSQNFILQMSPDASCFYDPQTHYVDSLRNDPEGKQILQRAQQAAYQAMMADVNNRPHEILSKQGFVAGSSYRCLKDFNKGSMRVWDSANGDRYRYDMTMDDVEWTPLDSTKTILGYQCQLARADYHGRTWQVWFAPEVPLQHGPWQLQGLPGLIMEAATADGLFTFRITGLQQCDEEFKPQYDEKKDFVSKRKSVLRIKANSSRNRSARISAMTGGAVKLAHVDEEDELLETDYKD